MNSAGTVKIVPVAREVDADPMVWERLASRMVPRAPTSRNSATVITAAGIDAETVRPTRSPRYAFAAPNTMPRSTPATTAFSVNSATGASVGGGTIRRSVSQGGGRITLPAC